MLIVRTVRESDLDGVLALAQEAYPGMTTLPPERDVLAEKIRLSIQSFAKNISKPGDETYFLVLEDTQTQEIVGTAAVIAFLGASAQFYSYKLNKVTQSSRELDKRVSFETLNFSNHFEGFAEVATLYLRKDYRRNGNGKLLARSRYLMMAEYRDRFPESVMADLRGYFDKHGCSPFWEAVGRHFFQMEFSEADLYGAVHGNQFIADLMPKYPLYVNMLPQEAQEVIGKPNDQGTAALEMLKQEGFRWNGHIDIFDGAPSVDAPIDSINTVKNNRVVTLVGDLKGGGFDEDALVAVSKNEGFLVCRTSIKVEDAGVCLPADTIRELSLTKGEALRYCLV